MFSPSNISRSAVPHGMLRARRAPSLVPALALLAITITIGLASGSPASAQEALPHTQGTYAKLPTPGLATGARLARDVSAFTYPAAVSAHAQRVAIPSLATPRVPSYPPTAHSLAPTPGLPACGVFSSCSFENGTFGWFGTDLTVPQLALGAYTAGVTSGYGLFQSAPTDGLYAVLTGWDGNGPGEIRFGQDVVLQPSAARLVFDYRAGWDMFNFAGSTLPRTFGVRVEPAGGGPALMSTTLLTANAGTVNLDTGDLTASVDISAFAGQAVRVLWVWNVPQNFTGPGMFQLDRIAVLEDECTVVDNCSFESGTLAGWLASDLTLPLQPAGVYASGFVFAYNTCTPTDGGYAFAHGWDGSGPGEIRLFQDVVLPPGTSSIQFDYRAGWNLQGATLPRSFRFDVEPSGGGAPLSSELVLTAPAGTVQNGTGPLTASVGLLPFAGQSVRLVFRWSVPENQSGPADFQLDRIRLSKGACASIHNCSFETGAFPAWNAADVGLPFVPLLVAGVGESPGFGLFTSLPTDGTKALLHGFDGVGPDVIRVWQDVTLPLWASVLRFDYRAGWDMLSFAGSTQPRRFEVTIEPAGGGTPLASDLVFEAPPQTRVLDTGPRSRTIPVDEFAGQTVRIAFRWLIPETHTGPGFFQLDRVVLDNSVLAVGPGGSASLELDLRPARPNPSRDATTFEFTLPRAGDVDLEVVDVRGARVWSERRAGLPAGEHRVAWNGVRAAGGDAPAGVYYARVWTDHGSSSRMFVRVR